MHVTKEGAHLHQWHIPRTSSLSRRTPLFLLSSLGGVKDPNPNPNSNPNPKPNPNPNLYISLLLLSIPLAGRCLFR